MKDVIDCYFLKMLWPAIVWKLHVRVHVYYIFACLLVSNRVELCSNCNNGVDWSDGCVAEWFGTNCSRPCETGCTDSTCHVDTGHCGNCTTGLTGNFCNETCTSNCDDTGCTRDGSCHGCLNNRYHGGLCTESCDAACEGCFQNNATCISCPTGLYGVSCEMLCSDKCAYNECDKQGHCKMGCTDGRFYGSQCDLECSRNITNCVECISPHGVTECLNCSNAKHGQYCENACPHNCLTCSSSTKCTECYGGFSGVICECTVPRCLQCDITGFCEKCEPGYFGEQCDLTCPDCETCTSGDPKTSPVCLSCNEGSYKHAITCLPCSKLCTQCTYLTECSGCKPGFYGKACTKTCSPNCEPDPTREYICDGMTGVCSGDCRDGFYSDYCTLPCIGNCGSSSGRLGCNKQTGQCVTCSDGYFGQFCNETCGSNCVAVSGRDKCGRDTGKCARCEPMYHGDTCEELCSSNCDGECDQKTGKCEVCKSKFYGDYCTEPCPDQCGPAPNATRIVCKQLNAECLYCVPGFYGERCQNYCETKCALLGTVSNCKKETGRCIGCLVGHYVEFCQSTCDHCKDWSCDQGSGYCLDGCMRGWFNVTCTSRCSKMCRDEECDWLTGDCLYGCIDGFVGPLCNEAETTPIIQVSVVPEVDALRKLLIMTVVMVPVAFALLVGLVCILCGNGRSNILEPVSPGIVLPHTLTDIEVEQGSL